MPRAKAIEVVNPDDEPELQSESPAIHVVSLEEALEGPKPEGGTCFWFGEIQRLDLGNGSGYNVSNVGQTTIHDPELIALLEQAALIPSNKIFKQ